jgi:cyclophilin family peptidyl-prolyl cis-trans isomerase
VHAHSVLALLGALVLVLAGCGSSSGPSSSPTATVTQQLSFAHPPPMTIDRNRSYSATVVTDDGTFVIRLLPKIAPMTVNNFVFLARHHYYDGNLIFRIIGTFMFQTGDPTGLGTGNPGYTIPDEKVTLPYTLGTVAMARTAAKNSGGSQFFVVLERVWHPRTPTYVIFGKVISGWRTLGKIASTPVQQNPGTGDLSQPVNDVRIHSITIS